MADTVTRKVADHNPWYTDDQTPEAPYHRRIIEARNRLILDLVEQKKQEHREQKQKRWWEVPDKVRVLDAGCGDGYLLRLLTGDSYLDCYGFDYNPVRVGNAKRNAPEATVFQKDLTNGNDWPARYFDVVVLSQVLEHVPEDEKALAGLVNRLRAGGVMVVGVPNEGCFLGQLRNRCFEKSISKTTDHVHFYRETEIREKLTRAGLKISRNAYYEGIMFPRQEIGNWLARSDAGFRFSQWLGNTVKSQCAGYYFTCEKAK